MSEEKQNYSIKASPPDRLLAYWAEVFKGQVTGNCVMLNEGVIYQYCFGLFHVITIDCTTRFQVELERTFTEKSWFPVVISDNVRKFEAKPTCRQVVSGGYIFTNIDGITRYSAGRMKMVIVHLSMDAIRELLPVGRPGLVLFENREKFFFEQVLSSEMLRTFQLIMGLNKEQDSSRNYIRAYAWMLLAEIFAQIGSGSVEKPKCSVRQLHIALKAEKMLLEDLSEPKTVQEIASLCNVSSSHLRKIFAQVYQTTMHQYLHSYRMQRAREYLQTGKNVSEVAFLVGYTHLGHFSDAFKQFFGTQPSSLIGKSGG